MLCFTKVSLDGTIEWQRNISLTDGHGVIISSMIRTYDGNFVIAASIANSFGRGDDILYLKLDSSGSPMWVLSINAFDEEVSKGICELPDHTLLIAASSSDKKGIPSMIFTEVSENGTVKSVQRISPPGHSISPNGIILNAKGVPVVTGAIDQFTLAATNPAKMFLLTMDDNTCLSESMLVVATHLATTMDSNVVVESPDIYDDPKESAFNYVSGGTEFNLCDILSVLNIDQPQSLISLFPNPLTENATLNVKTAIVLLPGSYELSVRNALGKQVYSEKRYLTGTEQQLTISISDLPSGIYTVELLDANTFASVWCGKIVKVN
jgi:hypothetical protein